MPSAWNLGRVVGALALVWVAACQFDGSGQAGLTGGGSGGAGGSGAGGGAGSAGGAGGTGGSGGTLGDALSRDGHEDDKDGSRGDAQGPDGPAPDAPPPSPGVACGAVNCTGNMPVCCVYCATGTTGCRPNANSCMSQGGRPLSCDGPEDCPGQMCCMQPDGKTSCENWCASDVTVCRPGECGGCCPHDFDPTCGGGSYYRTCGLSC